MSFDLLPETLAELPLFPLHQAVLFPGMLMPLHVFEPRYRALVADVLGSHRSLAIPHLIDPARQHEGQPTIARWAGMGTIVEHAELPGGRYRIMVLGRARVELDELTFVPPYRRAKATLYAADDQAIPGIELAALTTAANAFAQLVQARDPSFRVHQPKDAPAGVVIDAFAHQLIISPRKRQHVLETLDLRARAELVTEVLTVQRASLSSSHDAPMN